VNERSHPPPGTPPDAEEQRPAAASREEREGTPVGEDPRLDPRARVLVVEDEHELRELIAQWLETRNYQVVQAADGRDAVNLLEAGLEPDVILLDLAMPRMDGRQFLDWLRASPEHRDRRVIVASGYLDDERPVDVDRAFSKPFRPDLLERELARLASGE
jgi:CheY-like chemotaxis protein